MRQTKGWGAGEKFVKQTQVHYEAALIFSLVGGEGRRGTLGVGLEEDAVGDEPIEEDGGSGVGAPGAFWVSRECTGEPE